MSEKDTCVCDSCRSRSVLYARIDSLIDIHNFKNINFIAAGGLSINDVKTYQSLGYKAIVIGDKGIIKKKFDPKIYEWLKNN